MNRTKIQNQIKSVEDKLKEYGILLNEQVLLRPVGDGYLNEIIYWTQHSLNENYGLDSQTASIKYSCNKRHSLGSLPTGYRKMVNVNIYIYYFGIDYKCRLAFCNDEIIKTAAGFQNIDNMIQLGYFDDSFIECFHDIYIKISQNISEIGSSKRIKTCREYKEYNDFNSKYIDDMIASTNEECILCEIPDEVSNFELLSIIEDSVDRNKSPKWMHYHLNHTILICCCLSTFILLKLYYTKSISIIHQVSLTS